MRVAGGHPGAVGGSGEAGDRDHLGGVSNEGDELGNHSGARDVERTVDAAPRRLRHTVLEPFPVGERDGSEAGEVVVIARAGGADDGESARDCQLDNG